MRRKIGEICAGSANKASAGSSCCGETDHARRTWSLDIFRRKLQRDNALAAGSQGTLLMWNKRLNVRLLMTLLAVIVLLGITTHLLHAYQMRRFARNLRARAEEAESDGRPDQAVSFLSRSLSFSPQDPDTLARYGQMLDKVATTPRERSRALAVLQQAFSRNPSRQDLRIHIAKLAIEQKEFEVARKHLTAFLDAAPERADLQVLLARCEEADGAPKRAAAAYERAVALTPGQVDLYVRLAALYRDRLDQPEKAAEVMDQLVQANPKSHQAHLARMRFRMVAGAMADAERDLATAVELAPAEVEVLLAGADLAREGGRIEVALAALRRGIEQHSANEILYIRLAELEAQTGHPGEAIAYLRKGLDRLPDSPALLRPLGELLVEERELNEATKVIDRLRGPAHSPLAADYLKGRVLAHEGRWLEAARRIDRVCAASRDDPSLSARAYQILGQCCGHLGYADLQVPAYQQALTLDPSPATRLSLAEALLGAGRVDEAIDHLRQVTRSPAAPAPTWVRLGQALLRQNLSRSPKKRDWRQVDEVLERAGQDSSQSAATALFRANVLTARNQLEAARELLERARRDHPKDVDLNIALSDLEAARGDLDAAARLVKDCKDSGRGVEERVSRLAAWAQRGGREAARSLEELARDLDRLGETDRVVVARHLAAKYHRAGDVTGWIKLCTGLGDKPLTDLAAAHELLYLAMQTGELEFIHTVAERMRKLEGEDGTSWRYGAAAFLVAQAKQGDRTGLGQARTLLAVVGRARPGWARPPLLEAQIEELEGRFAEAADRFVKAIDLGDRQLPVVHRTVQLLLERGRYLDADRVIRLYQQQATLGRDFGRQAAEIALRIGSLDRALELAREVVPEDSADFREHLWLGQMQAATGRRLDAEQSLRHATTLAPRTPEVWITLVAFLAQTDQAERAEAIVGDLSKHLAADQVPLARARCWEVLGRPDRAEAEYRDALGRTPKAFRVLQAAIGFYLRLNETRKAEPLLRTLLTPGVLVPEEEVPAIRRQYALVLSESGDEARVKEALALLEQNRRGDEAVADRRTRALVEATRTGQRKQALQALDGLPTGPPPTPEERFRLAKLFEAEDDWPRAHAQLQELLAPDGYNPVYLTCLLQGLLCRRQVHEARPWLARLERVAPDSPQTKAFREQIAAASEEGKP
jgi:tetratricopeptide (TPR) repeat protein